MTLTLPWLGADLLLFPELRLTGYDLRDTVPNVALAVSSAEVGRMEQLSRDLPFVAGLALEGTDHRFFNSARMISGLMKRQ